MIKPGNLVNAGYQGGPMSFTGIVLRVEEKRSLFSEKFAIMETETVVHILCDGAIKHFILEEDNIEVII